MKQKLAWFIGGCIVSWLAFSAFERFSLRPRDHSKTWQQADRQSAPWLQHSLGRRIGPMLIFTPPGNDNCSAVVYPADSNGLPGFYIEDEDHDGHPDSFLVADSAGHYISLDDSDSDGTFDAFTYNTGFGADSYSLDDKNMDGVYDQKVGPGRNIFANIGGKWLKLEFRDGKQFVIIDGKPVNVIANNDLWSLAPKTDESRTPALTE